MLFFLTPPFLVPGIPIFECQASIAGAEEEARGEGLFAGGE